MVTMGNETILCIKTSIGKLYVKKVVDLTPNVSIVPYMSNKYHILADVLGFVNLVDDRYFKYGIIIEECYHVSEMTTMKLVRGLISLSQMHKTMKGAIHGDCNPSNIMQDKYGNLKLVDPCNLLNGYVQYQNVEYYDDLSCSTELSVFIYSCLEIFCTLNKCEMDDIYLKPKDDDHSGSNQFADLVNLSKSIDKSKYIKASDYVISIKDSLECQTGLFTSCHTKLFRSSSDSLYNSLDNDNLQFFRDVDSPVNLYSEGECDNDD